MKIRLGYVAIALKLEGVTTSSPVTYKKYSSIESEKEKLSLLKRVAQSNLEDLIKVLNYNIENDIHFYRMTSKLIPLATHKEVLWDYAPHIKKQCAVIGELIAKHEMRVDTHPDQFNVLNSVNDHVIEATKDTLQHHLDIFGLFNILDGKMVLHVGGKAGGKEQALDRFKEQFKKLPTPMQKSLIIENDDKVFSARDVLTLCQSLSIPMVLDVHHHKCYNEGESLHEMLSDIFQTWSGQPYPPKIHFSSPKESEFDRRHADYLVVDEFINFVEMAKELDQDFDVMIEAKQKDLAIYRLVHEIKEKRPDWKWDDFTTLNL
ncbi:MAG TPA: UV DNA damage repair endonuclease UvsE [Firmicutes bacterium]|nr:UV DNA damage repair endonuclease UvsE [Bacillota bacterium]